MGTTLSPDVTGLMRELRSLGFTQNDIATATAADVRSVRNWQRGTAPSSTNEDRLRELHYLASELSDSLDAPGPAQWMRAPNRTLRGRKPLAVLAEGDYERVLAAVNAYLHGAYL
jgi:hypothetical protein